MQLQMIKKIVAIIYGVCYLVSCDAQESYVVRITASNCSYSYGGRTTNILTGFFLKDKGIVTALHGVCGCKTIAAEDAAGKDLGRMNVSFADLENDVALLSSERGISFSSGFEFSNISPSSLGGQKITMIGFGYGVAKPKSSEIARVRRPPVRSLIDCIKPDHIDSLRVRNSPSVYNEVLDVEIPIAPGCSGAPIIFNEKVVGVANGGLEGGSTNYCWAIPVTKINFSSKSSLEPAYSKLAKKNPAKIFVLTSVGNEENKPVEKIGIITLSENENCTDRYCKGIKNIIKIEILSFVVERRYVDRPDCKGWESKGEILSEKNDIAKLEFGIWKNPECQDAKQGKWQGTGWHFPSGSCCIEPVGNRFAAVSKITVRVIYLE